MVQGTLAKACKSLLTGAKAHPKAITGQELIDDNSTMDCSFEERTVWVGGVGWVPVTARPYMPSCSTCSLDYIRDLFPPCWQSREREGCSQGTLSLFFTLQLRAGTPSCSFQRSDFLLPPIPAHL